jgi:hypothetical protein
VSEPPFPGEAAQQRHQIMVVGARDVSGPFDLDHTGMYPFGLSADAGRLMTGLARLESAEPEIPRLVSYIFLESILFI